MASENRPKNQLSAIQTRNRREIIQSLDPQMKKDTIRPKTNDDTMRSIKNKTKSGKSANTLSFINTGGDYDESLHGIFMTF